MKRATIAVSLAVTATIGVACSSERIGGPAEELGGPHATFEAEWVGVYEGTGSAELFDIGESYSDVPVCVGTWLEAGRLRGIVRIQLFPPPDALLEIADGLHTGGQPGACAGNGVVLTASSRIEDITSRLTLMLTGPDGFSGLHDKRHRLQLERRGDELIGLTVFRAGTPSSDRSTSTRWKNGYYEIARLHLHLDKVR
jgi:hypothetical protein